MSVQNLHLLEVLPQHFTAQHLMLRSTNAKCVLLLCIISNRMYLLKHIFKDIQTIQLDIKNFLQIFKMYSTVKKYLLLEITFFFLLHLNASHSKIIFTIR